jgi:hypothetical protein
MAGAENDGDNGSLSICQRVVMNDCMRTANKQDKTMIVEVLDSVQQT